MERINGVTCIKGEIHSIMTLLRLNTRWSQPLRSSSTQEESPVVQLYRRLNEYLEGIYDIRDLDCVMYLTPFHHVIVSNQGSGPLTSAALSSLSKFVMFGFMSLEYPRIREGITLIANCISRCVFEETDWESDEVILMKLLELSTLVLRCDASSLLTVSAVWDIYSTCISIHGQYRASKILRSEAETALRHLTLTVFSRASFPLASLFKSTPHIYGGMNPSNQLSVLPQSTTNNNVPQFASSSRLDSLRDSSGGFNTQSQHDSERRGTSLTWDELSHANQFSGVVGITLLLSRIISALSGLSDLQSNSVDNVKFALSLVNIALEAGGPALGQIDPVVDVLRGDICRHLLRASQSDDLAVFSLTLRVVFNLFMSIKDHMKTQLEVFLTSVHLRLLQNHQQSNPTSLSLAREELALESLLEFCREPSLMQDLYANYDCDEQCTNLFDSIISTLCARCVPMGAQNDGDPVQNPAAPPNGDGSDSFRSSILTRLSLYGVTTVVRAVAARCNIDRSPSGSSREPTPNIIPEVGSHSSKDGEEQIAVGSMPDSTHLRVSTVNIEGVTCTQSFDDENSGMKMEPGQQVPSSDSTEQSVDDWCVSEPDKLQTIEPKLTTPQKQLPQYSLANPNSRHDGAVADSQSVSSPFLSQDSKSLLPNQKRIAAAGIASKGLSPLHNDSLSRQSSKTYSEASGHDSDSDSDDIVLLTRAKSVEVLRQRKEKKQRMLLAAEKFNSKPLKNDWIEFALEQGLLVPTEINSAINDQPSSGSATKSSHLAASAKFPADPCSVARFLKDTPGLGKTQAGEFLSKGPADLYPFNAAVLREYVNTFDFTGKDSSFVKALRLFLGHFRLPGEAQCIDRLMEAFAGRLFEHLGAGNPFANADAAFILSFSTIMLNTDLHNPQIQPQKRMTKEQFIRNNRGINADKDLPREYLETLYDEIKARQIQVDFDIGDNSSQAVTVDLMDPTSWNKLLHKGAKQQLPAAFTPTVTARRTAAKSRNVATLNSSASASHHTLVFAHERDMFLVMAKPVFNALMAVWDSTNDDNVLYRVLEGILDYSSICLSLQLNKLFNKAIEAFSRRILRNLEKSRYNVDGASTSAPGKLSKNTYVLTLRKLEAEKGRRHNLGALLRSDVTALAAPPQSLNGENGIAPNFDASSSQTTGSQSSSTHLHSQAALNTDGKPIELNSLFDQQDLGASTQKAKGLNWTGAALVRGELMVKVFFYLVLSQPEILEKDSWMATFQLLFWIRGRGCLPDILAALDDEWYDCRGASGAALGVSSSSNVKGSPAQPVTGNSMSRRPPSAYAARCHAAALGIVMASPGPHSSGQGPTQAVSSGGSSIWSSIGSLIWNNSQTSNSANLSTSESLLQLLPNPLDANSSIFAPKERTFGHTCSDTGTNQRSDVATSRDMSADDFLCLSVSTSSLNRVLPTIVSLCDQNFMDVMTCMLEILRSRVMILLNAGQNGSESRSQSILASTELDAVVLLEWLTALVLTNKSRVNLFWSSIHNILKFVMLDSAINAAFYCPYLLERFVLFLLRCSCELMHNSSVGGHEYGAGIASKKEGSADSIVYPIAHHARALNAKDANIKSLGILAGSATVQSMFSAETIDYWASLRILRSLPPDITANLSDRIGAAMLTFVRISPGTSAIVNTEDWYLVFALMSNAIAGTAARPYIWGIIHYLINANLISEKNFSVCRHLLMRFLFGAFVNSPSPSTSTGSVESGSSTSDTTIAPAPVISAWQLPALDCVLRITCMALAGYIDCNNDRNIFSLGENTQSLPLPHSSITPRRSEAGGLPLAGHKQGSRSLNGIAGSVAPLSPRQNTTGGGGLGLVRCHTFPLPMNNHRNSRGAMRQTSGTGISPVASRSSSPVSGEAGGVVDQGHRLSVASVRLPRPEEVETLWLETVKTFADLSNAPIVEVARKSSFCLQGLLLAGGIASLPTEVWSRAITEILNRLPLSLVSSASRLTTSAEFAASAESCLRSCNVVFDVFVSQIKTLRQSIDFQTFWLRFTSILATNANVLPRGVHFHEEMLEMIAALMRLLRPPILPSANSPKHLPPKPVSSTPAPAPAAKPRLEEESSGIWSFLWSSAPAPAPQPVSESPPAPAPPAPAPAPAAEPIDARSEPPNIVNGDIVTQSKPESTSEIKEDPKKALPLIDTTVAVEEDEGSLLALSWKSMCSLNPMLQNNLKLKNPQLVADVIRFTELQAKRSAFSATVPATSGTKEYIGENSKSLQNAPSSPQQRIGASAAHIV